MTEQVIEKLKNGRWVFNSLANPVKQKFSQALSMSANSIDNISTTYLTTAFYKPGRIPTVLASQKPVALKIVTGTTVNLDIFNDHFF